MAIEVTRPAPERLEQMHVNSWEIWTCPVSKFPWHYEQRETCYILAGHASVSGGGQTVQFGPGDMVVFPEGLDCVWTVTAPIKKHYFFG